MLLWIAVLVAIAGLSLFLTIRSMRSFQPELKQDTGPARGLFLISRPQSVNREVLAKLRALLTGAGSSVSFERLFKGEESVWVLHGPLYLPQTFPDLGLLELEDYLSTPEIKESSDPNKVTERHTFGWEMPKIDHIKALAAGFLASSPPAGEERFFWQLVCQPAPIGAGPVRQLRVKDTSSEGFKVTARVLVSAKDPVGRMDLAKRLFGKMKSELGLSKNQVLTTTANIYGKFYFRLPNPDRAGFVSLDDFAKSLQA